MPDTTLDPQAIAQAVAFETAENESEVGDFVGGIELGDGVTDFRFVSRVRGYEGWQWSVTLYHDEELDHWTVNESTLVPTDAALMPPKWIPWKDRLEPTDLSVTDSIGTDPDDPRMQAGVDDAQMRDVADAAEREAAAGVVQDGSDTAESAADTGGDGKAPETSAADGADGTASADEDADGAVSSPQDMAEAITEFELSRRHVLSPLGRSQTAKRWYEGPHGPKALSTKTAGGLACESCGFFIPLKGELNLMFGVCANKWSPDDGRVVSLDHGCGEHSEIEPPEPSRLWVQSKPAFDDLHIDVVAQRPRDEHGEIELLERLGEGNRLERLDGDPDPLDGDDADGAGDAIADESEPGDDVMADADVAPADAEDRAVVDPPSDADDTDDVDDAGDPDDVDDVASEEDIDAQTVPDEDASDDEIVEHVQPQDSPELEAVVDLTDADGDDDTDNDDDGDDNDGDDDSDDADDADPETDEGEDGKPEESPDEDVPDTPGERADDGIA